MKNEQTTAYSKDELVYVVALMLGIDECQARKLDVKSLYVIFDSFSQRGSAFANLEDKLREVERERNELLTEVSTLKTRNKALLRKPRARS